MTKTLSKERVADLSPIMDTSVPAAIARWDDLLRRQVDAFFSHELIGLYASPVWLRAESVLDVGCGNGDYTQKLATFFPHKRYTGIDVSPGLIALARERQRGGLIQFLRADFFNYAPAARSDVVLMRFIVQHLSDLEAVLARADCLLRTGGSVLIIEPDLGLSGNAPPTPIFDKMLGTYDGCAAADGRLKGRLGEAVDLISDLPGWRVLRTTRLAVPTIGPLTDTEVFGIYDGWIDLCEQAGLFDFAFDQARHEIAEWARLPASFSRIGLQIIEVSRSSPTGRMPSAPSRPL